MLDITPRKVATILLRKLVTIVVILVVVAFIGYLASDKKDYPGKAEFQAPNQLITTNTEGVAFGNTDTAKQAATRFAQTIKPLQSATFAGGSGYSIATGGNFVTYCRQNPNSVAFLVHVPELRNYKDTETRQALAALAWSCANLAARDLTFTTPDPEIIIGLRGFGSYGPIWSGRLGSKSAETKTDEIDEVRRLYPFFLPPPTPSAADPASKPK